MSDNELRYSGVRCSIKNEKLKYMCCRVMPSWASTLLVLKQSQWGLLDGAMVHSLAIQ